MVFYFSVTILILALGAQWILRSLAIKITPEKIFKYIFYGAVVFILANSSYLSYLQYKTWKFGSLSNLTKFFLPPYQSFNYFAGYSLFHFFAARLVALILAFLFIKTVTYYNKRFEDRFFHKEEYYLGALAIFLSGFPGMFAYLIVLFLLSILGSLILNSFSVSSGKRVSFYYLWIPAAIFVIIISKYLEKFAVWQIFKL